MEIIMKTNVVLERLGLRVVAGVVPEEFSGVYAGDFLSRAMSRVGEGDLWITIMNNVNVIAVASLADAAAVILAEDVVMDDSVIATAEAKGVTVLLSSMTVFELCAEIAELMK